MGIDLMFCSTGDHDLVSSLLFDVEVTRGVVSDWTKQLTNDVMLNRISKDR